MPPTIRRVVAAPVVGLLVLAGAASCGGTVQSGTAFCERVTKRLDDLKGLNLVSADPDSTKKVLAAFEDVGKVAPAPVRDAWTNVTKLVQEAATANLSTQEAAGKLAEKALATQPDVTTIKTYVKDTCGFELV